MIIPVILAGGSGTRLWPVSRKSYPKQFTKLSSNLSLFQESVMRLTGPRFSAPSIVTGTDFRFVVAEQLEAISAETHDVLLEPEARNTAPAILAAALRHEAKPDAILLVTPSDHKILDQHAFAEAIDTGAAAATAGKIVTFGISPSGPETGYGYLELTEPPVIGQSQSLRRFVEKPELEMAEAMIADGRYLWNAGIFMFRVDTIIKLFEQLVPHLAMATRAAVKTASYETGFMSLNAAAYSRCENISVDYAIMEAADDLHVVPVNCGWSDLGSWRSVHENCFQDGKGNAMWGAAMQIDCSNSLLRSENPDTKIVGVGLENIAAIATDDGILIANMDDSERVKEAVGELKLQKAPQAEEFRKCQRPWGHYEQLTLGSRFQVKRITVKPGGRLSLQSHKYRAEHWVVVEGIATVTRDDTVMTLVENQSTYIPLGAVHRLENKEDVPLTLIEVQSGSYLGEDDIVRYEDDYARVPQIAA
ncbi:mannose-1-phosphate guanylyltransferase/mannose-6-phosphate isomerase [Ahrensia marina]|jgi:mannose-1-phosphate guanylyltransferase/mannose-1-phosphate guanylyltransferase/mannose-6-phosphate isomerase|uniref:mannose-1-phosphate guanylyltransferase/mannose-6-phosphate isomerase n=1 Tax=Ahrensia marina TaxID=1514904 RepID=UPI0035D10522